MWRSRKTFLKAVWQLSLEEKFSFLYYLVKGSLCLVICMVGAHQAVAGIRSLISDTT